MTIKECIDIVDNIKPNQYSVKDKVLWLSFIDEIIINDVLKTHEGYDGRYDDFIGYSEDKLSVALIVPSPYDRLYTAYLKMKIDGENGETARYNNSAVLFNSYMLEYRKYYNKTHMPLNTAEKMIMPGAAHKHSVGLTDAEYENLKKELEYSLTEFFSDSVSPDKLYNAVYNYAQNNLEMLKGKDGETPIKGRDYLTEEELNKIRAEAKGDDGISPKVDIVEYDDIHKIIITDAYKTQSINVRDGKDAVLPKISLTPKDNGGYTLCIGEQTAEVEGIDAITTKTTTNRKEIISACDNVLYSDGIVGDWAEGYILNPSIRGLKAMEKHFTTPFIPCKKGDVVTIYGLTGSKSYSNFGTFLIASFTSPEIAEDGSTQSFVPFALLKKRSEANSSYNVGGVVDSTDGVYSYQLWKYEDASFNVKDFAGMPNEGYFRVSGILEEGFESIEDVIITINQPETYEVSSLAEKVKVPKAEKNYKSILNMQKENIELDERISKFEPSMEIILPRKAVAVAGHEFNIYTENVVFGNRDLNDIDAVWELKDSAGNAVKTHTYYAFSDCWRITPNQLSSGVTKESYTLTLTLREKASLSDTITTLTNNKTIATKSMELIIINDVEFGETNKKNVLFIGDSMTFASVYPAEIQFNLSKGGITSIGTMSRGVAFDTNGNITGIGDEEPTKIYHEGRNSWASWNYVLDEIFKDKENPFYDADTKNEQKQLDEKDSTTDDYIVFNFSKYMETKQMNGATMPTPDLICLNLGTNGLGAHTKSVKALNVMIESIKAYYTSIRKPCVPILVSLIAPTVNQDMFGLKAATSQRTSTANYQFSLYGKMIKAYIEEYDGKMDNVDVSEIFLCLDRHNDFGTAEQSASARNPKIIIRINDGHPNKYGYLKMADTYYANILYHLFYK